MSMLKIPAALLVTGAMLVGLPAKAAPTAPRSAICQLMAQESDVVTVHFGGWGAWHHGPDVSRQWPALPTPTVAAITTTTAISRSPMALRLVGHHPGYDLAYGCHPYCG